MAELVMNKELKHHWLTHTAKMTTTPPVAQVIAFIRERADQAEGEEATISTKHSSENCRPNKPSNRNRGSSTVASASPAVTSAATSNSNSTSASQPVRVVAPQSVRSEYPPCRYSCPICSENHYAYHCSTFKDYTPAQRKEHVLANSLCSNCLKPGHASENCRSTYKCKTCKAKHNSLLHEDQVSVSSPAIGLISAAAAAKDGLVMTANVLLTGTNGITVTARAFLDSGSTVTLVSNKLRKTLALRSSGGSLCIDGVAGFESDTPNPLVHVTLSSNYDKTWKRDITAEAMPKVIRDLPLKDASVVRHMPHLQGIALADPVYHRPGPIDILLGQNVFQHLFLDGRVQGPPETPAAWQTVFGWTIMGFYEEAEPAKAITASAHFVDSTKANQASDDLLVRFWKLEEPENHDKLLTPEESRVEQHYEQTHQYLKEEKRYMVSLPKSLGDMQLGESRSQALNRAKANERSLIRKQRWPAFQAVMSEYLELGHAKPVSSQDLLVPNSECYYMPVHSVYKETSTSTKVRAVFDASAPSATRISLNDLLAVGPTIQPSLDQTLLRFRQYPIAISGDISKMYREILLAPEDRALHRFLWRAETTEPWVDYEMHRVTFGVTTSPYVAVKTLQQAARDFGSSHPKASHHIEKSFYVDDFFAGADTPAEAVALSSDITNILSQAGFHIKKWRSSSPKVISEIPSDLLESIPDQKLVDSHSACYPKALGLVWDSKKDQMATHVDLARGYSSTKRGVVSDIAKTFDILGWCLKTLDCSMSNGEVIYLC